MERDTSGPEPNNADAGIPKRLLAQVERLLAHVDRLTEDIGQQRGEVEDLQERLSRMEQVVTAYGLANDDSVVRRRLLERFCHALEEGHDLELDEDRKRRRTARRLAGQADLVRADLDRRGLSPGDLDDRMGWPKGRTERLLAEPAELTHAEARRFSAMLDIPMAKMLELEPLSGAPGEEPSGGAG